MSLETPVPPNSVADFGLSSSRRMPRRKHASFVSASSSFTSTVMKFSPPYASLSISLYPTIV